MVGKLPLKASRRRYPFLARVFADGGYAGRLVEWAAHKAHITLQIIRRGAGTKGFEVLPRRWVAERTFAWISKNRRLVRDYEQIPVVAETLITIAASATLLHRWPCANALLKRTLRHCRTRVSVVVRPVPSIANALEAGGVILGLQARALDVCGQNLIAAIVGTDGQDRPALGFQLFLQRFAGLPVGERHIAVAVGRRRPCGKTGGKTGGQQAGREPCAFHLIPLLRTPRAQMKHGELTPT